MIVLLSQIDKYFLLFFSICSPVVLEQEDLVVRLKCSRVCMCRGFPSGVSTYHPTFSFGVWFLLSTHQDTSRSWA